MEKKTIQHLIQKAREAALHSYSPYSKFRVGAALMTGDGLIFTGTNVENRSYGATLCAERSAVAAAVSSGARDFEAICVAGLDYQGYLPPCGICVQVLAEFNRDMLVILTDSSGSYKTCTIAELMPLDFTLENQTD